KDKKVETAKNDPPKIDLPPIEAPKGEPFKLDLPPVAPPPIELPAVEAGTDGKDKKDKGEVSGTVMLDGKALPPGFFVTLVSSEGKRYSTAVQEEGSYRFTLGVPVGT